jgi:hypothetical protein
MNNPRINKLEEFAQDLRSAAIVLARQANDNGKRSTLDEVITELGFDRESLEAELEIE